MHQCAKRYLAAAAMVMALSPAALLAQVETATFDSDVEDFVFGDGPAGTTGGFIAENLTAGLSGAGELQATVKLNAGGASFVADPNIGGTLTNANALTGSGEFYVGPASGQTNGSLFLGHMTTANGDGNQIGIQIADGFRFFAGFADANDGGGDPERGTVTVPSAGESDTIRLTENTAYRFNYVYVPNLTLTANVLTAANVPVGTAVYTLNADNISAGINVSAFGAEQGSLVGPGTALRLDGLTYTAVPEPASLSLLALTGLGMLRRRRA